MIGNAGFKHVTIISENPSKLISIKTSEKYFKNTDPKGSSPTKADDIKLCVQAKHMAFLNRDKSISARHENMCETTGIFFNEKERYVGLEHIKAQEDVLKCVASTNEGGVQGQAVGDSSDEEVLIKRQGDRLCTSPAQSPQLRYVLILENDQYLSRRMLHQLTELILLQRSLTYIKKPPAKIKDVPTRSISKVAMRDHNDKNYSLATIAPDWTVTSLEGEVSIFTTDDSFHEYGKEIFGEALALPFYASKSPYTNSYELPIARTVSSYMMSESVIRRLNSPRSHWLPQRLPVDLQLTVSMRMDNYTTHAVYPPLGCHGSRYVEEHGPDSSNLGQNKKQLAQKCTHCCHRFYNVPSMDPNLQSIDLIDDAVA
jgi:hypothetical protein